MAVKIKYDVNNNELKFSKELIEDIKKELKLSDEQADKLGGSFKGVSNETKKTKAQFVDLKGIIAKLGIAAAIGAGLKAFVNLQKEIIKTRKETALLTKETGASLDRITAKALATAKVFDKDYNEVIRAANTLSKEFGISYTDALDQINEGFVRGVDVNGEYLDSIREYSSQVKSAGLNQAQFIDLLETSVQEGIFSDKGIDVVKEAALRLRELTPAARAALDQIGISSKQIEQDLATGQKTIFEVIQQVSERLGELPPQSAAVGTAIADIFGGPGEDAGLRFITLLKDVDGELGDVNETTKGYIERQQLALKAQEDLNLELVKFSNNWTNTGNSITIFLDTAGAKALSFLNSIVEGFIDTNSIINQFEKNIQTLELEQLKQELEKLEEGPTFFQKLGAAIGGFAGQAKQAGEAVAKIGILQQRIRQIESGEIDLGKATEDATEKTKLSTAATQEQQKALESLQAAIDGAAKSLSDFSIAQEIVQRKSAQDLLPTGDIDKGLIESLIFGGKEADQIAEEQESALNEAFEIGQKFLEKQKEQEDKIKEGRELAKEAAIQGAIDLGNSIFDIRNNNIQRQIDQLSLLYEREVELAGDNQAAIEVAEQEKARKIAALRQKQARNEKAQAIFGIGVNTGLAIIKTASQLGFPAAIPFIATVSALGLAQSAIVAAQKVPTFEFHRGTKSVPGYDTSKDSVHTMLTPQEMVIDVPTKKKYYPALDAIFDHRIPAELINSFVKNPTTNYHKEIIRDSVHLNIDRHGFSLNQRRNLSNYRKQVNRYRFA